MNSVFEGIYNLINIASGPETADVVHNLSDDVKFAFIGILKREEFVKGHVLSEPERPTSKVYFIEKGLIYIYTIKDGKEVGSGFFAEGGIGGDIISFLTRRQSEKTVKVLESSVLWAIDYNDLEGLYASYKEAENWPPFI